MEMKIFMSQRRGITTDQLANIIEVIQLGKKTGTLTVERGQDVKQEEGELVFVRGQVMHARCGRLLGQTAVDWLVTWGSCRYLFLPNTTNQATGPITQLSPVTPPPISRETNPKLQGIAPPQQERPWQDTTGPMPRVQATSSGPHRICKDEEGRHLLARAGLSRLHLHLFLLIDGQRSTLELVRLMGRTPDEVQQLLRDLEKIRVIQR